MKYTYSLSNYLCSSTIIIVCLLLLMICLYQTVQYMTILRGSIIIYMFLLHQQILCQEVLEWLVLKSTIILQDFCPWTYSMKLINIILKCLFLKMTLLAYYDTTYDIILYNMVCSNNIQFLVKKGILTWNIIWVSNLIIYACELLVPVCVSFALVVVYEVLNSGDAIHVNNDLSQYFWEGPIKHLCFSYLIVMSNVLIYAVCIKCSFCVAIKHVLNWIVTMILKSETYCI